MEHGISYIAMADSMSRISDRNTKSSRFNPPRHSDVERNGVESSDGGDPYLG